MMFTGVLVNALAILAGGLAGLLLKGRISEKYSDLIFDGLSLCVIVIGIMNALSMKNVLVVIFSVVLGSLLGQWLELENRAEDLGRSVEKRIFGNKASSGDFAKGFITTSLIYCIGSMAIVGSFESALKASHTTLFAKAAIDGAASILFSSTMGIGVAFSSVPVLLYQGLLVMCASTLKPVLTAVAIADMSSVGGILIMAIGLNVMKVKKIAVANMLPAIFLPLVYYAVMKLFV